MNQKNLIIDCFAGGGGASVGIEMALKMIAIFVSVVLLEGWFVFTTAEIVKNIETILKYLGITPPIKIAWGKWKRARKKKERPSVNGQEKTANTGKQLKRS